MSKFNWIEKPTALPGSCAFCGRVTDPNGFVDTGMEIEFHGAIQVCYGCVSALHSAFGFDATARSIINEDAVANVQHLVSVVNDMKESHEAQLNALLGHVSGLDRSFVRSHEVLVQAAGAREVAIAAANDRAAEQARLDELGLDSDIVGSKS